MRYRQYLTASASALLLLSLAACAKPATKESQALSPKEDFYSYVNQAWIDQAEIPADAAAYSVVSEMTDVIAADLRTDIDNLVLGKETSDLDGVEEFISFYKVATDFEQREKDGAEPIKKYLAEIEALNNLSDLVAVSKDWVLKSLPLPFGLSVDINIEKTDEKQLALSSPKAILPDVSLYEDDTQRDQLLDLYGQTVKAVLVEMGYTEKKAEQLVEGAIAFDALIVPYLLSAEEASDITNMVNPKTLDEVETYSKTLNFAQLAKDLVGQDVSLINVPTLKYFEHFDKLVTEEHFQSLKAWLLVQEAMSSTSYLNESIREAAAQYGMALSGVEELPDKIDVAYELALDTFSPTFSVYYGQKYFGQEAKQEVTAMVDDIVSVYKERLAANDWLSESTKEKAIEKLDKMTYYIGYPDEVQADMSLVKIDEDKSLLDNLVDLNRLSVVYSFEHFNEPIDKTEWVAPSYEVNAFYDPTNNSITFPAAILQAPFYSSDQSLAQNYGGIGSVIGHEITHAFDNNGALFDAEGNMMNWWTAADFAAFEEKTKAMIAHFDGADYQGHKVNGTLTVGENIADAGGISASLEALIKRQQTADLKEFFESYAATYKGLVRPEVVPYLLLDTHAPDNVRVNLQVNLLPAFYETYDVKEGDAMYLPEDKRVKIW